MSNSHTYRITRHESTTTETGRMSSRRVELGRVEARTELDAVDKFLTERGVREHFTVQGRGMIAFGVGTIRAERVEAQA